MTTTDFPPVLPQLGMDEIKLMIVDDHTVVRDGLASILGRQDDFQIRSGNWMPPFRVSGSGSRVRDHQHRSKWSVL